ncbi:MAG: chorismate synthase [Deltaproteobacteria bacterium]|nr:chorismate synthase [Deltaproteobacteria bacterium]
MQSLTKLRYLTSGESHGPGLYTVLEGMPSGLPIEVEYINDQLARRQKGYGRGGRMKIETDQVEITAGVRHGYTLGAPICLSIQNSDWKNWQDEMSVSPTDKPLKRVVTRPRPGHADLVGGIKYDFRDLRNVLERASARETTSRVACGAVARRLLEEFGVKIAGHVTAVGPVRARVLPATAEEILQKTEETPLRCLDAEAETKMVALIDEAKKMGDSLGGIFEIVVDGLPPGLGSYVQWDRKLDGRLAQAMLSIQAVKGVEIGDGFDNALKFGSQVHDPIYYDAAKKAFTRSSNRAGGLEGSMTTGLPLIVRGALKPISTLYEPLHSVDIETKQEFEASVERSDTCAIAAAAVIGEAVIAITLADAFLEKFGGDSLREIRRNYDGYIEQVREY